MRQVVNEIQLVTVLESEIMKEEAKRSNNDTSLRLNSLFQNWIDRDLKSTYDDIGEMTFLRDEEQFVKDGIFPTSREWRNIQPPKILFILKEPSGELSRLTKGKDIPKCIDHDGWDAIIKSHSLCDLFKIGRKGAGWSFNALGRWAYGLKQIQNNKSCSYDEAQTNKDAAFLQAAIMNLKKTPGGTSCVYKKLKKYVITNKDLIKSEIEIILPDLAICCGHGVFDLVKFVIGAQDKGASAFFKHGRTLYLRACHPQVAGKKNFNKLLNIYKDVIEQ